LERKGWNQSAFREPAKGAFAMVASDFNITKSPDLAQQYLPLARGIARRLQRRYRWVDADELYSYALWGLTLAARAYQPDRSVSFATFAATKGMFLAIDAMRREQVVRRKRDVDLPRSVCMSQLSTGAGEQALEPVGAKPGQSELTERKDFVQTMLRGLKTDDRRLLLLRYADGLRFKEIAGVMNRCEATICYRHKTLMTRLRRLAKADSH